MDEIVDIIDSDTGLKTGEVISKNEAHSRGVWHSSIHIIIISKDFKRILLQQRCAEKKFYPNFWDLTVGGHVGSGEEPLDAAKRELKEELGLISRNIKFLKVIKESLISDNIKSNEFVSVFLIIEDFDVCDIVLQKEEVKSVKWFSKSEFLDLINSNLVIPHEEEFKLVKSLLK